MNLTNELLELLTLDLLGTFIEFHNIESIVLKIIRDRTKYAESNLELLGPGCSLVDNAEFN